MWTLVYFSAHAGGWRAARTLHCPFTQQESVRGEEDESERQITGEERNEFSRRQMNQEMEVWKRNQSVLKREMWEGGMHKE